MWDEQRDSWLLETWTRYLHSKHNTQPKYGSQVGPRLKALFHSFLSSGSATRPESSTLRYRVFKNDLFSVSKRSTKGKGLWQAFGTGWKEWYRTRWGGAWLAQMIITTPFSILTKLPSRNYHRLGVRLHAQRALVSPKRSWVANYKL